MTLLLPTIDHVIAVASGKGGVGKSTVAVNLAVALARIGLGVSLLDADIYGPSVPRMLALSGKPEVTPDKKLLPKRRFGVTAMSIGFLVNEETPAIWRGPMVQSALEQMLRDVVWPASDIMVIDMPPGTGDAQLSISQRVKLAGAVIVSTPQDIALIDARKAIAMFRKVEVPILGLIENMSYFDCPHCHQRSDIFHHGGAAAEATRQNVPFLGEIPLDLNIRIQSDNGEPITANAPDSPIAQRFLKIAESVWQCVNERHTTQKSPPRITVR